MKILTLDFETYYDDEYSLRKMPTPNYILDKRFECICVSMKELGKPAYVVEGREFPKFLALYPAEDTMTVAFNALFDNSILAWRYGYIPRRMVDAMGMARAMCGHLMERASLDYVAGHLGLGTKTGALAKVKGLHFDAIRSNRDLWNDFVEYAIQDAELCEGIFCKLFPKFPINERAVMDLVLRATVQPKFQLDVNLLVDHLNELQQMKENLLKDAGVDKDTVMAQASFQRALEARGVEVELKPSPSDVKKGVEEPRMIPAFAKTDLFMSKLAEHEDPVVQALAAARLGHKSTIEETRCIKLLSIAQQNWPQGAPMIPVPLGYGKAHTHRLAGEWGMNMQNMPTARGSKGKSKLRDALVTSIMADEMIIVADKGQIEARMNAYVCGEETLLQQFRDKLDPYAKLASSIFGFEVNRKVNIIEGFIGKTGILGLGYGAGPAKFYSMVALMARSGGIDLGEMWTPQLAMRAVFTYRSVYSKIPDGWTKLDNLLKTSWLGRSAPATFGPVTIGWEDGSGYVEGPGGLRMWYANPRYENGKSVYDYGREKGIHMYGAKMLENIVQFLSRIDVMESAIRIANKGYNFALQAHDELVYIVPTYKVEEAKAIIHTEMTRSPVWAPMIPLTADVGTGRSYGAAK